MKAGDGVEVRAIWASQGPLKPPCSAWFKGYEFVSTNGITTVVKHTRGLYEGMSANYPAHDVRPAVLRLPV